MVRTRNTTIYILYNLHTVYRKNTVLYELLLYDWRTYSNYMYNVYYSNEDQDVCTKPRSTMLDGRAHCQLPQHAARAQEHRAVEPGPRTQVPGHRCPCAMWRPDVATEWGTWSIDIACGVVAVRGVPVGVSLFFLWLLSARPPTHSESMLLTDSAAAGCCTALLHRYLRGDEQVSMTFLSIAIYFRKYEREHMVLGRSHGHRGIEIKIVCETAFSAHSHIHPARRTHGLTLWYGLWPWHTQPYSPYAIHPTYRYITIHVQQPYIP